jgi:phosphoglycerate dehydrogenase-like enzyme
MYGPGQLEQLLREAQYIFNALPLTAATRGLIGPNEFALMRRDAVLINIGRGPTFQTDALVHALQTQRIAGAGLDVTDPEPLPAQHALWQLENVIITPHYSGGRPGYMEHVTQLFLENLQRYSSDRALTNVVDVSAGY